jgi:hypothetical protein
MADQNKISEMLEHLINDEQDKAEEIFHEYIVAKSREIYEGLIETELDEASDEEDEKDEDEDLEENFEDLEVIEADDETDDLVADVEMDDEEGSMDDEEGDEDDHHADVGGDEALEQKVMDLEDQLAELEAEFAKLQGEEEGDMDDMGDDEEMKDDFNLETVREYVEKVATPKGGDNGANAKSIVAGKNDMGGTTANIVKGGAEEKGGKAASPKEDNAGNINVPGGKAGSAFSTKEPGHGAEKKGSAESADNKQSLFRG